MKIAVIGSGIAGLTSAYLLAADHEVTLFEAEPRLGGHTHTIHLEHGGRPFALDTGFLVYNERTYPNFTRLLAEWGVATQPSEMSFSMHCERSGVEYCGSSLRGLFAQPINLLRPAFLGMLADIARFNRSGATVLAEADESLTLGELIERERYGRTFVEHYLLPMGAAIWSASPSSMRAFPALSFVRFFANHGLLSLTDRPQWRTIQGGSARYIEAILRRRPVTVECGAAVQRVARNSDCVILELTDRDSERFDQVVIATHADTALRMLADPTPAERDVLGAFRFQRNEAVLHTDSSRLPHRRRAWASWNYRVPRAPQASVSVTYWLNRLQGIDSPTQFCVTLNDSRPFAAEHVLRRITFEHPLYSAATFAAQRRHEEVSGRRRTHYCGAYWGYGFHEDGAKSALVVAEQINHRPASTCKAASMKA
jgi:predicted NAD/FAD-binding protein